MTTQYPNAYDQWQVHQDNTGEKVPAALLNGYQDAIVAIENRLGVSGLTVLPAAIPAAGNMVVVNSQWYVSTGTAWAPMSAPSNVLSYFIR